jgi:ubiquinone/menaquinone biosynthesis C-methylase UbiE
MPRNPSFPSAWAFVRFKARIDWLRFAMGIGYERAVEYPWIFRELELGPTDKLIDVGSANTVFPLFVRAETGASVHCIDYDAKILRLRTYARKCGLGEALDDGTLVIQQVSGRRLPFPDSAFDKLSCISTIEHTPEEGDAEALLELFRIVRRGGRLAFSVPIAAKHTRVPPAPTSTSATSRGNRYSTSGTMTTIRCRSV